MLNNRILVIGLDRRYLELVSQMKSEFIFIHLVSPAHYRTENHSLEALIFEDAQLMHMGNILENYKNKPIWGIGAGPLLSGITWLNPAPNSVSLEQILTDSLGTLRAPPPSTGMLDNGTIVKNKTFPSWGIGVVKRSIGDDLFLVNFPSAAKITKKEEHVCHKSTLRIICNIKELNYETG